MKFYGHRLKLSAKDGEQRKPKKGRYAFSFGVALLSITFAGLATARSDQQVISDFQLSGVSLETVQVDRKPAFRIAMPRSSYQDPATEKLTDRNFMAWLPVAFKDGVIEGEVMSTLAPDAPDFARGFIGLAFRIDTAGRFESIYLRPTNSTAEDQVRRNHTVQYAAYPDFRFDALRREFPEKYESHADVALNRWIRMRIEVAGNVAKLYLDRKPNPALIVRDLKYGAAQVGGVGVWIETGTIAHFRNLRISETSKASSQ